VLARFPIQQFPLVLIGYHHPFPLRRLSGNGKSLVIAVLVDNQSHSIGANFGSGQPFSSSLEHVLAELERIDLLIQAQVRRARAHNGSNLDFKVFA
jgi:hypothetical protein